MRSNGRAPKRKLCEARGAPGQEPGDRQRHLSILQRFVLGPIVLGSHQPPSEQVSAVGHAVERRDGRYSRKAVHDCVPAVSGEFFLAAPSPARASESSVCENIAKTSLRVGGQQQFRLPHRSVYIHTPRIAHQHSNVIIWLSVKFTAWHHWLEMEGRRHWYNTISSWFFHF